MSRISGSPHGSQARPVATSRPGGGRRRGDATRTRSGGLRAGRVKHQHIDRTQQVGHCSDQVGDLLLVGDVGVEGVGHAAVAPDGAGHLTRLPVVTPAVNRDGHAVAGKPAHDCSTQPERTTRDKSDPVTCCVHTRSITPGSLLEPSRERKSGPRQRGWRRWRRGAVARPRPQGYEPRAAFFAAACRAVFLAGVFATFLALLTVVLLVDASSMGRRPLSRTHSCPRPPGAVTVFDSMNGCALNRSLSLPN